MSILFEKVTAITMDPWPAQKASGFADPIQPLEQAYVLVEGEKITYVGTEPPAAFEGQRINGNNKVLMPGLINAHTHLPMAALRGYADDFNLQTWLNQYIFPAEDKLNPHIVSCCTDLALAELVASGTVSITDQYFFCDVIAERVAEMGIKANLSRGISCFSEDFDFRTYQSVQEMIALCKDWHGYDSGRIKIDVSIHAEYTSHPKVWSALAEYAVANSLGMHIHLSETRAEHENCIAKYGLTPAAVLDKYGVFDVPTNAAHCVWVSNEDIALLAEKGVTAVYNPISNMKLASGIAPVTEMLAAGVNVALGTDSVASNNSHDLFEEVKAAALCQKVRSLNPSAMAAEQALRLAVTGGAKAQGREQESGMIKEGMDADLILLDFDRPHLTPCYHVTSNLVYSARGSDVVMNMVRGKIIYKDGEYLTLDIEKVKHAVRRASNIF